MFGSRSDGSSFSFGPSDFRLEAWAASAAGCRAGASVGITTAVAAASAPSRLAIRRLTRSLRERPSDRFWEGGLGPICDDGEGRRDLRAGALPRVGFRAPGLPAGTGRIWGMGGPRAARSRAGEPPLPQARRPETGTPGRPGRPALPSTVWHTAVEEVLDEPAKRGPGVKPRATKTPYQVIHSPALARESNDEIPHVCFVWIHVRKTDAAKKLAVWKSEDWISPCCYFHKPHPQTNDILASHHQFLCSHACLETSASTGWPFQRGHPQRREIQQGQRLSQMHAS